MSKYPTNLSKAPGASGKDAELLVARYTGAYGEGVPWSASIPREGRPERTPNYRAGGSNLIERET